MYEQNENIDDSSQPEFVGEVRHVTTLNFVPLSYETMREKSSLIRGINLNSIVRPEYGPILFDIPTTVRWKDTQDIIGDGNCLFNAFSFALTGTQQYHKEIRTAICDHISNDPNGTFAPWLRSNCKF